MALHSYASAYRDHIPAFTRRGFQDAQGVSATSWRATLLPQLDQQGLAGLLDDARSPLHEVNRPVLGTVLAVFQCPSSPGAPLRYPDTVSRGLVRTRVPNAPSGGLDYSAAFFYSASPPRNTLWSVGIVGRPAAPAWKPFLTPARVSACEDGLSNTIAVFEQTPQRVHQHDGETYYQEGETTSSAWLRFDEGVNVHWDQVNYCALWGIYSQHPHGAHVLIADGSTQFLPESTHPRVVQALFTRDNGDAVRLP